MPQIVYRANLAAAQFPFASYLLQGQTVIVGGQDQNFSRQLAARADQDRSVGIPQVFGMRNCMPVDQGYASLDLSESTALTFTTVNANNRNIGFKGVNGISFFDLASVHRSSGVVAGTGTLFSVYTLNGIEYGYNAGAGQLYRLNLLTSVLQALVGLPGGVRDMNASFGYNLAITASTFHWSSLTNPLDFTPSLISGAGSFGIQQAVGELRFILPAASGVFVVCSGNIVFLRYTGNPRFPFAAQVIPGSIGTTISVSAKAYYAPLLELTDYKYVQSIEGTIYRLTPTSCTPELPELSQYFQALRGQDSVTNYWPYPNPNNYSLNSTLSLAGLVLGLDFVSNRYLVFPFATRAPNNANQPSIVYDTLLQRYGSIEAVALIGLEQFAVGIDLGILTGNNGSPSFGPYRLYAPNNADATVTTGATLLMGRYQHVRGRMLELQSVDIQGGPPTLRALCSLKGDNVTTAVSPSAIERSGRQTRYFFDGAVGFNISLLLEGRFNITSAVLNFNLHGKAMYS